LALGADAVFIGTVALLALVHTQAVKVLPWEPPTALIFESSGQKQKFQIDQGGQSLANFLKASVQEMQVAALCLGKDHLTAVDTRDLSSINQELASYLGLQWCGDPAQE
ncbi:MAG TPA: FMN-binding glutamate synthase family protein, partial [Firmicutes bacterium]|nr:FMN-binding glutamate synthase family protein [Bacillota bacterium]